MFQCLWPTTLETSTERCLWSSHRVPLDFRPWKSKSLIIAMALGKSWKDKDGQLDFIWILEYPNFRLKAMSVFHFRCPRC